jgi:hypothetical protein
VVSGEAERIYCGAQQIDRAVPGFCDDVLVVQTQRTANHGGIAAEARGPASFAHDGHWPPGRAVILDQPAAEDHWAHICAAVLEKADAAPPNLT